MFDYNKLKNNLHSDVSGGHVEVTFFSKMDKDLICGNSKAAEFLASCNTKGSCGEIFTYEKNHILCGIGSLKQKHLGELVAWNVQKSMGALYKQISTYYNKHTVTFNDHSEIQHCLFGFVLASYKFDYLNKKKEGDNSEVLINMKYPKAANEAVETAHAQNFARFLGDMPANLMTPSLFVEYAKDAFKGLPVEIRVLEEEECRKLGMNLMLSVGQGSKEASKLLTIKYTGDKSVDLHKIAMIGKGVTFDTGGISLKPSLNMHAMKYDMMGGATVLATFKLMCSLNLKLNASVTIPLVENMPSSAATKPGDVHVGMNGLSVEVGNTDAEGRLILADAMTWAQREYKPEFMIDAATLTGAMCIALGNVYCGYFSNDSDFARLICSASTRASEMCWRMPVNEYYVTPMKSKCADLNNIGGRLGGSCTAAGFLSQFVEEGVKWTHFDIAGLMDAGVLSEIYGAGATGRPVAAFLEMLRDLSKK